MSPDPAGWDATSPDDPQSLNRYAYVENQPMNSNDPEGLILCSVVSGDGTVLWYDSNTDSCGENYAEVLNQSIVVTPGDCSGNDPNSAACMQLSSYSTSWQIEPTYANDSGYQLAGALGKTGVYSLTSVCFAPGFYAASAAGATGAVAVANAPEVYAATVGDYATWYGRAFSWLSRLVGKTPTGAGTAIAAAPGIVSQFCSSN